MMTSYRAAQARQGIQRGLRPSGARTCPRVVAGLRCISYRTEALCICQRHRHLLDHARQWFDEDGNRVLTGEPYDVGIDELARQPACPDCGWRLGSQGHTIKCEEDAW